MSIDKQEQEIVIPAEDEYLSDDGLIYCKKCGMPRQGRVRIIGEDMVVRVRCRCQQEEYDRQEEEKKHQAFLRKVNRMKAAGLQDKALYDYRFENDNGCNPQMHLARRYVENWEEMKESGMGLLLWGDVGTGKSFFAGCIANALLEQGIPVLMTNFARILNALTGMYSVDRNEYIDSLNSYELLIIDDLGIERSTDYAMEQIFNVIDSRYRSRKTMIICTNLTLAELQQPCDLAHARIYDRILEICVPIMINGPSFRKAQARENIEHAKLLLGQASASGNTGITSYVM